MTTIQPGETQPWISMERIDREVERLKAEDEARKAELARDVKRAAYDAKVREMERRS